MLLATTVVLVAGCGGNSHTSANTAALIAGPPITNAQALAYAGQWGLTSRPPR
jgi:hypothetical protein